MLLLLPFAWPYLRRDMARLKEAWKPVLVLGTLGIGAFNTPLYTGLLTTTAVNGLLLQEEKTGWIIALIVGGIAGWLARLVMNRDASIGIFWNIVVVCIGSPIGNAVAGPLLGISGSIQEFSLTGLIIAFVGAVILLGNVNIVQRRNFR